MEKGSKTPQKGEADQQADDPETEPLSRVPRS